MRQLVGVRWVDISKQDGQKPQYRLRFVGKGIRKSPMPELHVATPPPECLWMAASDVMYGSSKPNEKKLLICGVSRVYFYAPSIRPVYIKIVDEDWETGDE